MAIQFDQLLQNGGELDPALKRARLQAIFGPDYEKHINAKGDFEFDVGASPIQPMAQGPMAPQGPAPFKRGTLQVGMDLLNAGGLLSQAIGAEDWAQGLYEKAHDYENRIAAIPQRMARMEDVHSLKDAAIYGYERIAENVPMLASLMLPGGLVGAGAKALGYGATAARAAGWTAAFATDVGLQTGESVDIAKRAGQNPEDIRVVGSGIGKAMLDFIPFFTLAKRMGIGNLVEREIAKTLVEKGFLKRAAGHIGTMVATEVPTEVTQEAINIALDRSLQQKEGSLTDEEISQLKNAAAGAFAVSLGLGGAAAVASPRQATPDELNAADDAALPEALRPEFVGRTEPTPEISTGMITPSGELESAADFNPYSYNELFDEKTGEMVVTGKEYLKALREEGKRIQYDPFIDKMSGHEIKPMITPTRTGWYFDSEQGQFTYDRGEAMVKFGEGGISAWLKDGSFLGMHPTPELAMRQAEKYAYDTEPAMGIGDDGKFRAEAQEPLKKLAVALKRQPQMTPTETAVVEVADATPAAKPDFYEEPVDHGVQQAQLDPGMQKLLDARMTFLGDEKNYRSTDKQMKNGARTSLSKIDERIAAYAQKAGVPNPLLGEAHNFEVSKNKTVEEALTERATQGEARKYSHLSDTEAQVLQALEEKEREPGGGLTIREYEKMERLIAKSKMDIGVPESEREKITDAQVSELMKEADRRFRKEYTMVQAAPEEGMAAPSAAIIESLPRENEYAVTWKREGRNPETVGSVYQNGDSWVGETSGGQAEAFASKDTAENYVIGQHMTARRDITRGAPRNMAGELAQSMVSPQRKALEVAIIKAVTKIYNGLKIKPRVVFGHTWNTDLFPEGSQLQRQVQRYRGYFNLRDAGRVYMLLNNLNSVAEAEKTFIHETFAHFGLRAYFSPQELQKLLGLVAAYRGDEVVQHRAGYAKRAASPQPTGQITLEQAEEFIASKFEEFYSNGLQTDGKDFIGKFLALVRRFLRHVGISKFTDKDLVDIFQDIGKGLRQGVIQNNAPTYSSLFAKQGAEGLGATIGRDIARIAEGDINSLGEIWRAKTGLGVLTPLQTAERFNVEGGKEYMETTMQWWARKRTLTNGAVEIAETWQKLPKKSAQRLSAGIFEIREQSDELERRLTEEEVGKIFDKENVDKAGRDLYTKIDKEFQTVLANLETGLKRAVLRQHTRTASEADKLLQLWNKPDKSEFFSAAKEELGNFEVGARLSDIENQINNLRNRNYFPLSRFGKYAVTVRAKGDMTWQGKSYRGPTEGKRGEVVHFETTESSVAQQESFETIKKAFPGHLFQVRASVVTDEEFSFMGMPPALFDLIKDSVKLSEEQQESLKEIFYLRSPGRAFLRHLVKRRGTAGYSQDALRVFANYMMNAANHIARVEFNPDLTDHLARMRKFAEENGPVAGLVSNYFGKHHHYLMNPENDLSQLRALGFLWYLGFNVKSALVNLSQVPMVAYPFLASQYGDVKAIGSLTSAYKRVVDWRRGKSVLSKEMEAYVSRGIAEGFLDESRATELAGIAEGGVLHKVLPVDKASRVLNHTAYYGSYLFRHAEKFNREVVFLASLELAKSKGLDGEAAFKAARKAVQTTMFEYAKWNRPTFMRGKKSVFFLFWNYMQHLSYLAFGGEGKNNAIRINLMLLMAAGLQGLPFAENILDLIDWNSTEIKTALGSTDPRTDLRADIRELALTITDRPDLLMHGFGHYYGLGVLHAGELLNLPVPKVDISGSLSAGEPIPGIGELVQPSRDPDKKLGATLVSALGPVVGVGYTFWKALMNQDPDQWKVWERAMPTAMRVASQAARRSARGEETFRGGGAVAQFDPENTEHRTELIANALGFQPSRMTEAYALRSAQEDLREYWTVRRAYVMENFAWATLQDDPEVKKDAADAIARFNKDAPTPSLRLTPEKIQQSLRQRTRLRDIREAGLPNEKAFQPLYQKQKELYGGGAQYSGQTNTQ